MARVHALAYVHFILVMSPTGFAFWQVSLLAPVVELHIGPTELRCMFHESDMVHFWISGHGGPESLPPH
jgi:hypothetical protein